MYFRAQGGAGPPSKDVFWNIRIEDGAELLTAAPVSIDPCVVASFHETVFEGSEVEGALSRRCRYTKG